MKMKRVLEGKLPSEDPILPDTAESAVKVLKHLSVHNTKGATATPAEKGAWMVKHKAGTSKVYLRGHHSSLMNSKFHDFEDTIR